MTAVVVMKAERTKHQLNKQLYCRWRGFYHASPDGMTGDYPPCKLWRDRTLPAACDATFGWLTCPPAFVPLHTGLWVMDDCAGSCQHCHPGHHTPRTLCVCTRAHTLVCVDVSVLTKKYWFPEACTFTFKLLSTLTISNTETNLSLRLQSIITALII